jgi:holliday junction DNA helicase RuvA
MIASLKGRLEYKDATGMVVDCGGVGYGLEMSLSSLASLGEVGCDVSVWVYTHAAQDSLRLYGFIEQNEKACFELLLGTSGVGPKLALAVLSTFSAQELADVVKRAEVRTLVRIPGVGRKKAERLILELKDRLPRLGLDGSSGVAVPGSLADDLVSALVALGFRSTDADKSSQKILEENPEEKDLARLVRLALRASAQAG